MKRLFQSAILWRLAAVALIFTSAAIAAAPPAALGSGPKIAVIQFANDAGAPQSTVSALSNALYQAVESSGHYTAVGGGPMQVKVGVDPDQLYPALGAAGKAGAEEVILGDVVGASGGSVTYRLTTYRVDPLAFIRSQVFTQSSTTSASLAAGFVSNLATLHAPRTAIGTIYSFVNGVHADLGEAEGFKLGQRFNVVRNGQKMAEARISAIELTDATVTITNAAPGYKPQVGDQLVGLDPQPAILPAYRAHANTFSIWGILAATGVALLAIGHHGQPAASIISPSPTPSSSGVFSVAPLSQTGVAPQPETFTFAFSQPVNTGLINFANTTSVSYSSTNPTVPVSPVTNLGGPQPSFNPPNCAGPGSCVLTINALSLTPGQVLTFQFYTTIQDQAGVSLALQTNITFTASVGHHPAMVTRGAAPVPPQGGVLSPPLQAGVQQPRQPEPHPRDPHNPK